MKHIIITALTISSLAACTNNHHPVRTETMSDDNTKMKIEDDSRTLSISIKTRNTTNPIDYDKSFDVRDLNDKQKKELEKHILDSLGVKKPST
jgi:hypothetical protein